MKKLTFVKYTIRTTIITLMVIYFGLTALLNVPYVQQGISSITTRELKNLLETEVSIGNIDIGLLNRIIIQDLVLYDRSGEEALNVARFSAKFDILAILKGKIRINSIQLFGLNARLNKKDKNSEINFKFIADLFAPKKKKEKSKFIDLRINSIIIRRSNIAYDVLLEPETENKFNASHTAVNNLSVNVSIKALSEDSVNVSLKRISFDEKAGFKLKKLSLTATGNDKGVKIKDFNLITDNSFIRSDSICLEFNGLNTINQLDSINYKGRINAEITPSDMAVFVPQLKGMDETLNIKCDFQNEKNVHLLKRLSIYTNSQDLSIDIDGKYIRGNKDTDDKFYADINEIKTSEHAISKILGSITSGNVPAVISRIGASKITGKIEGDMTNLYNNLYINTGLGSLETEFAMSTDKKSQKKSFSGNVYSKNIALGHLANNGNLGDASFNIDFKGLTYNNDNLPESYLKGVINYIDVKGYRYNNIMMDGRYETGGFDGKISVNDENIKLNIDGSFNTSGKTPVFKLTAHINNFRPDKLKLTNKYGDTSYSLNIGADFTGKSIDDINGKISIDSLEVVSSDKDYNYFLPSFSLSAKTEDKVKTINLKSNFLNGEVKGLYSYKTLPNSILRVIRRHMPSLFHSEKPKKEVFTDNNFKISAKLENTDFLYKVLRIPVKAKMPMELNGYIYDSSSRMFINANIPDLTINDKKYESTTLLLENPDSKLHCHVRTNMMMKKGAMINFSVNALASDDMITTKTYWGNNTNVTYSGEVYADASFSKDSLSNKLHTDIKLLQSKVVLNDSVWNIHPANISIDKDSIDINNFVFEHKGQHIKINGRLGKKETDVCLIDLKSVNLAYVMDMIQFNAVEFEGNTNGEISVTSVFGKPLLDANLDVNNFSLNGALFGRAKIKGGFDNDKGRILLDADIKDKDNVYTRVKGYISPKEKGLDLDIDAGGTNLAFLQRFVEDIFSDIKGKAYGKARLYGPFKFLDIEGKLKAEIGMNVNILNNRFEASADSVVIRSGEFEFKDIKLKDSEGNTGVANGYLRHTKLKKLNYMFQFDTHNMKILHADEHNTDFPFYGNVYASGRTIIRGNENIGLTVDCDVVAENKTSFVYVLGAASEALDKQFITFVDKTPKRLQSNIETELYHYLNSQNINNEESEPQDIRINMIIEPTPAAEMKVVMDPSSGDYISARGTGSLRVNYFNKGDFQIFGNYNISEGIYKLSMQNVIRKDFVLRPGGNVSFNGSPTSANLNVQAAYTVPSASLNDLLADAASTRGNIKVNCIVNLSGPLTSPNLSFDLELPTVNEEDRQLVRSLTSTPEQMNTQIIYLLGIGKFYTYDYAAQNNQSNATSSLAFSTLSGQLNNMLSQVIDSQNWNLGTNLTTGQNGWSDVEAEAILSGKLLNNRLIINGNFGYKENTLRNTNFVGDFEAIWLLTKNGDFRLRGYNQTNDRYFVKSTLTTQGVGIMYKKDFTKWNELLDWVTNLKLYRKRKLSKNIEKENKQD